MRKIPTLFARDPDDMRHVTREVTPGCEWVLAGEGIATRKYDGTCVMYDGANWWTRREVKPGKTPPPGWVEVDHDETTGKRVGWEGFVGSSFAKVLNETQFRDVQDGRKFQAGTYELCGPKINGNPERAEHHRLVAHASAELLAGWDLTYDSLREHLTTWIADEGIEGIVWHHPDGRMAKLKVRDFA